MLLYILVDLKKQTLSLKKKISNESQIVQHELRKIQIHLGIHDKSGSDLLLDQFANKKEHHT